MHDVRSMPMRNNAVGRGVYASTNGADVAEELFDEDGFSYKELLQQYSGKQSKSSQRQSDSNRNRQQDTNRNQITAINFNSVPRQRSTMNLTASRAISSYAQQAGIPTKSSAPIAGAVAPRYRKDVTKGDVNLDGQIDNTDKTLMSEYVARKILDEHFHTNLAKKYADKNQLNLYAADIDNDGEVNLSDIIDIKSIIKEIKSEKSVLKGDLNDDGEINGEDIDLMTKYLLEEDVAINKKAADFGNDGKITLSDLSDLLNTFNEIKKQKSTGIKGDINNDGQVDSDDAMKLTDFINGKSKGYDIYNDADVDGNDEINSDDVEAIKNIYTTGKVQKPTGVLGDINNDGKVSLMDVDRLQNYVDGNIERSEVYNEDVNGDGKIDKADVDAVEKIFLFKGKFQENNGVLGDINNDGKVDATDLDRLNQHIDGKLNYANVNNEDVNGDGTVDMKDVRRLRNIVQRTIEGDANGDGVVDTKDYAVMRDYLEGIRGDIPNVNGADMDLDGEVTVDDLVEFVKTPRGYVLSGDVNADGVVDSNDVDDLSRYLNRQTSNYSLAYNADVNGDGKIDRDDVAKIQEMIAPQPVQQPDPVPPSPPPAPTYNFPDTAQRTVSAYSNPERTVQVNSYERVDVGDRVTVLEVDEGNQSVKVEYPTSKGSKIRWVSMNIFVPDNPIENMIQQKMHDFAYSNTSNYFKVDTKWTGGAECRGFAQQMYHRLFPSTGMITGYTNKNYGAQNYSGSYISGSLYDFSESDMNAVKALFSGAKPGAFVQMGRRHSTNKSGTAPGPHSAIVYGIYDDGVSFYEANAGGTGMITLKKYTWTELANRNRGFTIYLPNNYE